MNPVSRFNTMLRVAAGAILFSGGFAHAAFPWEPKPPCPPNSSCPSDPNPPVPPGTCGPAAGGAPCTAAGPAVQSGGPGINVGSGNPINVITGNKYQREVDMPALPGVLGLEIVRHYNSAYSRPNNSNGIVGRGWRLSYETELFPIGATLQLVQADGSRIIFNRDARNPSLCASANPADGSLRIEKTARGEEYIWRWTNGRQLSFNSKGKLVQILAPGGQFLSMQHDSRGMLVRVTDPQGRSLHITYLDNAQAKSASVFRGVQSIDSPVGRFSYGYGSAMPAGATIEKSQLLANLVKVGLPAESGASRLYHYENPNFPTLLTGISVVSTGADGKLQRQRIATYGYDINGKGNLTVKGEPARLRTGADGKIQQPPTLVAGTGIEQITLDTSIGGQTIISNSLGQKTIYRHRIIGGEYRLLEVRGVGCPSCAEPNMRYGYDDRGRLTDSTRLSSAGEPLSTTHSELDSLGRTVRVSKISYRNGKAGASQWQWRYEYAGASSEPLLIARPSVVPGKEYVTAVRYVLDGAAKGLPLAVTEHGYVPAIDGKAVAMEITRSIGYRYNSYGQRIESDGPLENAAINPDPSNSDITRTEYDPKTKLAVKTIAPGNILTEVLERDAALRPRVLRTSDGVSVQTVRMRNNWRGQPEEIQLDAVQLDDPAGKVSRTLRYGYDANGRLVSVTLPGNLTSRFVFDSAGRLTQRILPDGSVIVLQQDTEGHQQSASIYAAAREPAAKAVSSIQFHYDAASRLVEIGDTSGVFGKTEYTDAGQVAQITNALGQATRFDYDADGMLSSRTLAANTPDAATVKLARDSHGMPTMITDANGVSTVRRFDDFGRKVFESNPDRGISLYVYDLAGRLASRIDETRVLTSYRYDVANRLVAMGSGENDDLMQYRYKGQHLAEVFATPDGKIEHAIEHSQFKYDGLGQITEERRWIARVDVPAQRGSGMVKVSTNTAPLAGLTFVTRNEYDHAGRLTLQTLPDGHHLAYRYTSASVDKTAGKAQGKLGQLETILFDDKVVVSDIEQSAAGGLSGYTSSNGLRQSIRLDQRGRIEQLQTYSVAQNGDAGWWGRFIGWMGVRHATPASFIYRQTNHFDIGGRLDSIARQRAGTASSASPVAPAETYRYDGLDRLTGILAADGSQTHYAYDKGDNRTEEVVIPKPENQLVKASSDDVSIFANASRQTYQYLSGTNRLVQLTHHGVGGKRSDGAESPARPLLYAAWLYHPTGVPLAQFAYARAGTVAAGAQYANRRLVYNAGRRPIAVFDAENHLLARYSYNGEGERIAKTVYPARTDRSSKIGDVPHAQLKGTTVYSLYRAQRLAAEADNQGRITAHYVYLEGKPVARIDMEINAGVGRNLWKSITTLGGLIGKDRVDASDSQARIYAIHTDHLGTPQVVTDDAQHIVWQGETTPFGKTKVLSAVASAATGKAFEMNLRLPGQVYDAETGLNQNYYRDYDPQLGRYSTTDPMGLGGGTNPYAYVSNNPLSNIDPLGLYQSDIHYYMTFFLGIAAGMSVDEARVVALAAQYVDDNDDTRPLKIPPDADHRRRLLSYHFTMVPSQVDPDTGLVKTGIFDYGTPATNSSYANIAENDQIKRLFSAVKTAEEEGNLTNIRCTKLQFMGEYLHSFEDTFAHRDKNNQPFALSMGGGHALSFSEPDFTYNDVLDSGGGHLANGWYVREDRTLQAEKEVFEKLKLFGNSLDAKSIGDLVGIMDHYNKIKEHEGQGYDPENPATSEKINYLESVLRGWSSTRPSLAGINLTNINEENSFKGYVSSKGASNRKSYLCDKNGNPLNQKAYAGTILPGSCK